MMKPTLSSLELWGHDRFAHKRDRQCRVCLMEYDKPKEAEHTLCPRCLEDPQSTLALIDAQLVRVRTDRDALCEAWVARQVGLPDALGERWSALVAARTQAEVQLEHVKRGKRWAGHIRPQGALEEAENALATILRKIDRTRAQDLSIDRLLNEEKSHIQALGHFHALRVRWEMARSDLEVSQGRDL